MSSPLMKRFAERLAALQSELGFTKQSDFGKAVGVSQSGISDYLRAGRAAKLDIVDRIAEKTGVPACWLLACEKPDPEARVIPWQRKLMQVIIREVETSERLEGQPVEKRITLMFALYDYFSRRPHPAKEQLAAIRKMIVESELSAQSGLSKKGDGR